jgi:hypothetical protein
MAKVEAKRFVARSVSEDSLANSIRAHAFCDQGRERCAVQPADCIDDTDLVAWSLKTKAPRLSSR